MLLWNMLVKRDDNDCHTNFDSQYDNHDNHDVSVIKFSLTDNITHICTLYFTFAKILPSCLLEHSLTLSIHLIHISSFLYIL